MLRAFLRLLLVTLVFSIGFQLSLFLIRKIGQKKNSFPPKKSTLFSKQKNMVFLHGGRSDLYPFQSQKALQSVIENPNLFLAVDLEYTLDSNWKIASFKKSHRLLSPKKKKENTQKASMSLELFLNLYPKKKPLLIKIFTFEPEALFQLLKTLRPRTEKNKISQTIIESPFSKTLNFLRKKSPQLFFASHDSSFLQLQLMSFLFIETFYKMKPDLFIWSPKNSLPLRALKQIQIKQKKNLLKIKNIKEYKNFPLKDFLHGIYIDEPESFFKNCSKIKPMTIKSFLEACS